MAAFGRAATLTRGRGLGAVALGESFHATAAIQQVHRR
jgi:hypothetical protein